MSDCIALLVMAAMVRMTFQSRVSDRKTAACPVAAVPATTAKPAPLQVTGLIPQQQEWADKAVLKYAAAQDKKWRRWNAAMFE